MTTPLRLDVPALPRKLGAALLKSADTLATTFTALRVLEQAEAVTQEGRTLPAVGAALAAAADKVIRKRLDANGSAAPSAEALPMGPPEGFVVAYFHPERRPSAYTVSDMPLRYGRGDARNYVIPTAPTEEIDFNAMVARLIDPDGDGVKSLFFRDPRVPEGYNSDPIDLLATERGFTHVGAYVGHSNWRRVNELPELPSSMSGPADSAAVREFFLSVERRAAAAAAQARPGTPSNWAEAMERYTDALGGVTDTLKSIQAHEVAHLLRGAPFGVEISPDAVKARIATLDGLIADANNAIGRNRHESGWDGGEGERRDRLRKERGSLAVLLEQLVDPVLRTELDAFVATANARSST